MKRRTTPLILQSPLQGIKKTEYDKDTYLTSQEAATYLRTSCGGIRNLVYRKRLPAYRPFKRLLFKKVDLDRIVETSKIGGHNVY